MERSTRLLAAVAVALIAGGSGACGGGDGPDRTMTIVGTEMRFEAPQRVAAGDYSVTFQNAGTVVHELAFRHPSGEFTARRSIAAGESVDLEVTLDPGVWELGCFEPGHHQAGMHAQLIVEPG